MSKNKRKQRQSQEAENVVSAKEMYCTSRLYLHKQPQQVLFEQCKINLITN